MILKIYDAKQFARSLDKMKLVVDTSTSSYVAATKHILVEPVFANKSPRLELTGTNLMETIITQNNGCRILSRTGSKALLPFAPIHRMMTGWSTTVISNPASNADSVLHAEHILKFQNVHTECEGRGETTVEKTMLGQTRLDNIPRPRTCKHNRIKNPGLHADANDEILILINDEIVEVSMGDFSAVLEISASVADFPAMQNFTLELERLYTPSDLRKSGKAYPETLALAKKLFSSKRNARWAVNETRENIQIREGETRLITRHA